MKIPANGAGDQAATASSDPAEGEKKRINPELWQACAGPLVNMPVAGTHVVYFPQGHSEQVAASMKKDADAQIPNYPNLPSKLLCLLHNVSLLADPETDEVYAQMTLLPVPSFDKDALLGSDLSMKTNKPQTEFFCKTLTASDTSTHGGFSVPRRAAEKTFPPLDFTMQPPAQELVARDLHNNVWTFRHIYRGQPKRHLLTTGWSLFVSGKRLFAGDAVLFIRDEKQQLLLGIRRANRQPANLSSSVLSSDSMHIGILAAAAHAAANNSPFTVFYNPRASPSEFVIPLAKYYKAVCSNQISLGMRFRMMFETEESGTRRYMGTITGISDLDPVRWKNSQWRNLQVGWDESTAGEKRNRVSIWEIEPITAPFFICPTTPFFRSKCPRQPGMPDDDLCDPDSLFRRMPWLGDDFGMKDPQASLPGFSLVQWMNMQQQNPSLATSMQPNCLNHLSSSILQTFPTTDVSRQYNNLQFNNTPWSTQPVQQQLDQLQKPLASVIQTQQPFNDTMQPTRQNLTNQMLQTSQVQSQLLQSQNPVQSQNVLNNQLQRSLAQNLPQQPQQPQDLMPFQSLDHVNQQLHVPENQIQLQVLQKLHQQQQALLAQQSGIQQDQHKSTMLSQSHIVPQQMTRNNSQTNLQFAQPKLHQQVNPMNNQLSGCDSSLLMGAAGGGQSGITDEVPSCSTSPSTNNCSNAVQLSSTGIKNVASNGNVAKELQQKPEVKPSVNISKNQNQGLFPIQTYLNPGGSHIDYLDSSCSATSVLSQNDIQTQQNFNSQSMLFRAAGQDRELQGDRRDNNVPFGDNCGNQLGMPIMNEPLITKSMMGSGDFSNNLSSGGEMLSNYKNPKETHPELSSSLVTQSFGVPDMAFNSIDSTINDSSFMNGGAWAPPPQMPIKRTFTKVYKRGAVGRSIDIARYSGYEELKQDLARRFGIEGQLEDRQRVGWKLVYVDHENDVLLVGDDPWEEFVNCVRYIKILSPQEVQQMSLDGDFGNSILPNQDCSSSDNGQEELTFRKRLS